MSSTAMAARAAEGRRAGYQERGPDRAGPGQGPPVGDGSAEGERDLVLRPGR